MDRDYHVEATRDGLTAQAKAEAWRGPNRSRAEVSTQPFLEEAQEQARCVRENLRAAKERLETLKDRMFVGEAPPDLRAPPPGMAIPCRPGQAGDLIDLIRDLRRLSSDVDDLATDLQNRI